MFNESVAEYYYHKLEEESNPAILVEFLRIIKEWESVDSSAYKIIGRLSKVYGLEIVYYAILDVQFIENFTSSNMVGLLSYFCKKRLAEKNKPLETISLDKEIKQREKMMERKRLPKVKDGE